MGETGPVECVIIPIEANHLFRGNSGIYLDMTAFELKEPKDNQTHLIKTVSAEGNLQSSD